MEIPASLYPELEFESSQEFENPSEDFGQRVENIVFNHTFEVIPEELKYEFNVWADVWTGVFGTWRDFIHWIWRKIVQWGDSLWK